MATPKHVVALLILAFLSVSISVEARDVKERQAFSKFTNANDNDDKENARVIPTKEVSLTTAETLKKQENQEQQPTFLPQTKNGYGLYGHEEEMVKNTPATATPTSTGNRPSKTTMPADSFYSYPNGNFENSNNYYNDRSYDKRSNNYYNKDAYVADQREQARDTYVPEEQNFGGNTRLQDSSYTTTTTTGSRTTNDRNNYFTGGNRKYIMDSSWVHRQVRRRAARRDERHEVYGEREVLLQRGQRGEVLPKQVPEVEARVLDAGVLCQYQPKPQQQQQRQPLRATVQQRQRQLHGRIPERGGVPGEPRR
ncbi:hypothetical protein EUGRSUZ_E03246 [Eucalyptus grandis]|uniref:Uncharacterized protein n=2 Tax=Eucalyptus grandis TaxID=71139 RepID=A0ACC3L0K0_EUCGR|nr:hypothetical protein EUGRSUZ_E03246 [Eucalyptus grandis]